MTEPTVSPAIRTLSDWFHRDVEEPLAHIVGGPARLKIIVLLACVLGLDAADKATVGAVAAQLEQALNIGNVQIGWLVTASTAIGAVVTLPFGAVADKVHRTRLLVIAIVLWSLAMIAGGASNSYLMLLLTRLFLGAVVAAAGPAVVSLIGDLFKPGERGRIFGYILAGELIGVAFGFLISGNVAAMWSWRVSFWTLAVLGLILAVIVWRRLPEPARGGQSIVPIGAEKVPATDGAADTSAAIESEPEGAGTAQHTGIEKEIKRRDIEPHSDLVLQGDPTHFSLWQAVRYILSVRSFRVLAIASALGYFYFTGLRTFAIVFMRGRFDLSQASASSVSVGLGLGAIAGVLIAGRMGDALIRHGRLNGRVLVGAAAYLLATAALLPGLLSPTLLIAGPCFFFAAAGIGGANPAIDSARLDVMHSGLWGRAEGVRATMRLTLEAIAPPVFGYVSTWFAAASGASAHAASAAPASSAAGLDRAFLLLLAPLAAAGLIVALRAARTYPRDVATAIASEHAGGRAEPRADSA